MSDPIEIKKGDIFKWRYKDTKKHEDYLNYWCCTRTAIANETHLVDTYWSDNSGSHGVESFENALKKWELTFIANMEDLEKIKDWENVYYKDEDIVNLNHSNQSGGAMFKRKGAERSVDVMKEYARRCLERYQSQAESALSSVEEYKKKIGEISSPNVNLEDIYLQMPK